MKESERQGEGERRCSEQECEKRIRETEAQAKLFVPSLLSSPSHHLNSWWSESVNGSWVLTIPTYICSLPLSCPKLLSGVVWNSFMLSWVMIMNFMTMIVDCHVCFDDNSTSWRNRCKQTLLLEIEVRQEWLMLNYYITTPTDKFKCDTPFFLPLSCQEVC